MHGIEQNCFEVYGKTHFNFGRLDEAHVEQGKNERKWDNIFERIS